jgi:serine protease
LPTSATSASYFPKLTVAVSPTRSFSVQLSVLKIIAGTGASGGGNVGPVYVLLINPDTGSVAHTALATYAGGRYTWSYGGYTASRVQVLGGTDLDNDGFVCAAAEVCGGYPLLGPDEAMTLTLSGNRNDLDFTIAPLVGLSTSALPLTDPNPSVSKAVAGAALAPTTGGWPRTRTRP